MFVSIKQGKDMVEIMSDKYDAIKLSSQLCFPLYVCSKEIVRLYKPFLDELDLTYTQYITMMALWEQERINVKDLGEILFLDSGTLTPVLKKLECKGYIYRSRSETDERVVIATLTPQGLELKEKAVEIPYKISECLPLEHEEALTMYQFLSKILKKLRD